MKRMTKHCKDCNVLMFNVGQNRLYCDKCRKERQRLSQKASVKKHYNDPINKERRRRYHHKEWVERCEAKEMMNIALIIEEKRQKIMRGEDIYE